MGTAHQSPTDSTLKSQSAMKRYNRCRDREHKRKRFQATEALLDLQKSSPDVTERTHPVQLEGEVQNDSGNVNTPDNEPEVPLVAMMRTEIQRLISENHELKERLKKGIFSPDNLKDDNDTVKYYTGLDYHTLMTIYNFVKDYVPERANSGITKFEKVMLVLMKLRLNLGMQDLAYRFKVSKSCVSKIFLDVIHILYVKLKLFILWPEREALQMAMPMEFQQYFGVKVSVIIDCFDIFIERPSNLLARAETWSHYKHHNTVKYLIGITPQGAVSFLSKAWGGTTSDKYITENCGLLSKLLPGDVIVTGRGFDRESGGLFCAEVEIPAFTQGKSQLSPVDIETTRKIARTRIHVERVIGLVRNKFKILQNTLPIEYLHCSTDCIPTIDKITTLCCALTNMCRSVVPFD
ncbi:uncharacterized protein LOC133509373 [Syngnathoides biaculeatus]|uniref:uncharacterized protein LOC133509373 n=1 Tax=Syngnathoides biaculeatus TaxID=300417 RepID=UPI002ADDBFA1|nr:uncharacterized protein LOC133509373 [Syngnathoides biaculeatus]